MVRLHLRAEERWTGVVWPEYRRGFARYLSAGESDHPKFRGRGHFWCHVQPPINLDQALRRNYLIYIIMVALFVWPHAVHAVQPEFGVVIRIREGRDFQEQSKVCQLNKECVFTFRQISLSIDFANRYAYLQIVPIPSEFVFLDEVPQLLLDTDSKAYEFSIFNRSRDGYVRFGYNEPVLEVVIAVTLSD